MEGRAGLADALAELRGELWRSLARVEALHAHWGGPPGEGCALRRPLLVELQEPGRRCAAVGPRARAPPRKKSPDDPCDGPGGVACEASPRAQRAAELGALALPSGGALPSRADASARATGTALAHDCSVSFGGVLPSGDFSSSSFGGVLPSGDSSSRALAGDGGRPASGRDCSVVEEKEETKKEAAVKRRAPEEVEEQVKRTASSKTTGASRPSAADRWLKRLGTTSSKVEQFSVGNLAKWSDYHSHAINLVVAAVIVASSINVGAEIQCGMDGAEGCTYITDIMENVFCAIFVIELIIRYLSDRKVWKTAWFQFDMFVISISAVSVWVLQPVVKAYWVDVISQVTTLRTLRLLRLMRVLGTIDQFQEMWKLATGLMSSLKTVLAGCIMILMTLYVFACLGMEMINSSTYLKEDVEAMDVIRERFSSVHVTMITLFQFASGDGIEEVYRPLVMAAGQFTIYFLAVWLVVTVVLMNLISAVIVDNAIAQGGQDRDMQRRSLRRKVYRFKPYLKTLFEDMSRDGQVSRNALEFGMDGLMNRSSASTDAEQYADMPKELRDVVESGKLLDLFDFLDEDGSGTIDWDEFCHGVSYLALQTSYHQSIPTETLQTLQMLREQKLALKQVGFDVRYCGGMLSAIQRWDSATRSA